MITVGFSADSGRGISNYYHQRLHGLALGGPHIQPLLSLEVRVHRFSSFSPNGFQVAGMSDDSIESSGRSNQ